MKHYYCRPPICAFTPKPKVKHSADRKAHDALFSAVKRFFDSLTDEQQTAIMTNKEEALKFEAAYAKAETLYLK